jgi:hypothetical protein
MNYLGLPWPGLPWATLVYLGYLGYPCLPLATLGNLRLPWATLSYMGYLGLHGLPWATLGYLGRPWAALGFLGPPWAPLGSLGLPWAPFILSQKYTYISDKLCPNFTGWQTLNHKVESFVSAFDLCFDFHCKEDAGEILPNFGARFRTKFSNENIAWFAP